MRFYFPLDQNSLFSIYQFHSLLLNYLFDHLHLDEKLKIYILILLIVFKFQDINVHLKLNTRNDSR